MSSEYVLDKPDHLTCPECGGALARIEGDPIPKYACHIGHVLTGEAMLEAQADRIENLLESALALLNERRELCRQLRDDGLHDHTRIDAIMREATRNAELLRDFLNGSRVLNSL
jgi:two-component system chemotaxis response regulator CheB